MKNSDVIAIIPVFTEEAKTEALDYLGINRLLRDKYTNSVLSSEVDPYQDHNFGLVLLEEEYNEERNK